MYDFPSRGDGTTWSGSSATSSSNAFSPNNLNTDIVEQVWRSSAGTSHTLQCVPGTPEFVLVDTFAMLNHNLTLGATITFEGSNNGVTYPFSVSITPELENCYWVSPDLPTTAYKFWRVNISDPSNPDGYLQIGSIVFGSSVIFTLAETFTDDVNFGLKQFDDKIYTEGFTNVSNDRGQKKYLGLNFELLKAKDANFKNLRTLFKEAGTLLKVLYIPTPQDPSEFAVFAKMKEIPQESHKQMGERYVSLSLDLDESL
jgi:hypothetical protein